MITTAERAISLDRARFAVEHVGVHGYGVRALTPGGDAVHVPIHSIPELARTIVLAQQAGRRL